MTFPVGDNLPPLHGMTGTIAANEWSDEEISREPRESMCSTTNKCSITHSGSNERVIVCSRRIRGFVTDDDEQQAGGGKGALICN